MSNYCVVPIENFWTLTIFWAAPEIEKFGQLKVSEFQKQIILFSIFPKKRMKNFYSRILTTRIEVFRSFFGRIENKMMCFRDLLTFKKYVFLHFKSIK